LNDPVRHPDHYTWLPGQVEVIDITELFNFNVGNAIKYLMRAGRKGGPETATQDLSKAEWYVRREIERLTKGAA
jgi:Protein of unknwon function (DUF3310)